MLSKTWKSFDLNRIKIKIADITVYLKKNEFTALTKKKEKKMANFRKTFGTLYLKVSAVIWKKKE